MNLDSSDLAIRVWQGVHPVVVRESGSIEASDGWKWYEPGDSQHWAALDALQRFVENTIAPCFPAGVHKFRSFDGLERQCQEWAAANFDRYRQRLEATRPT